MGDRSAAGRYAAQVRWGRAGSSTAQGKTSDATAPAAAGQKDGYITSEHPDFDARLKRGARVRQILPNGKGDWQTISNRKGDMVHLRPDTFNGKENFRRTYGLHRRFWNTLEIQDEISKSVAMEPVNKRDYDTQQRRALAEQGKALPDGSFPIVDRADLANALQAIGRAGNRKMAEAHIRRRAKALDATDMLPDWIMKSGANISRADQDVLDAMQPVLEGFMSENEIALLYAEVEKASGIVNTTGVARENLEKAAAIIAGAIATRSFGGNRSAAGQYAARVRWGSGSSSPLGQKTTSPVGASGWKEVDSAGAQALSDIDATLGSGHPEHQRVSEAIGLLRMSRRADKDGEGEVLPDAAARAHRDAGTAGMMLTIASKVKGVPESVGRFSKIVNDIAAKLKARADEARKS